MNATIGTVIALLSVFGTAYGTVWFLDGRYQPNGEYVTAAEFKNVEWSLLRDQVKEDRARCEAAPDDPWACDDYEETLARFCKAFPEDRLCREETE